MTEGPSYAGVRVAVIGAAGFVGRWVAAALCRRGAEVHALIRDRASAEAVFAAWRVNGCLHELDLAADLADNGRGLREFYRRARPQITFNLAGYGVDPAERDADTAYRINARLAAALAACATACASATCASGWPGRAVVHAGSALEYGAAGGDLREDTAPRPTTLYGQSKLAGTHFLAAASLERGLPSVTARLFTVYGPGEHPGRLLPALVEAAQTGADLPLTAGTQRRDFTYVEDVADGLLRLGLTRGAPGEVVNLATGKLASVREFAEQAAAVLEIPRERLLFGSLPQRAAEMDHGPVNIDRLRRLTGWAPETPIAAGVRKTKAFLEQEGVNG